MSLEGIPEEPNCKVQRRGQHAVPGKSHSVEKRTNPENRDLLGLRAEYGQHLVLCEVLAIRHNRIQRTEGPNS